jgi:holo-[acyl-carrier protein] synthase
MASAIGLDLVDLRDVAVAIACFGARYLSRVYTDAEVAYAMSARDHATIVRRLAARFAAKEATIKALGASERGIGPRSIEIVRKADGAVRVALSGPALAAAREVGATALAVSMTHEGEVAAAVVVASRAETASPRSRIRWKR